MILVMAEEFQSLPLSLQKISSTLVHNRNSRTAVICGVIVLMSLTSSISLIDIEGHNPEEEDTSQQLSRSSVTSNTLNFTESSSNPLPIILNLSLKANNNNSITININDQQKTQCGDKCLQQIIGNFNGIITDAENITRLANQTSNILQNMNKKLTNLKQGMFIFRYIPYTLVRVYFEFV